MMLSMLNLIGGWYELAGGLGRPLPSAMSV